MCGGRNADTVQRYEFDEQSIIIIIVITISKGYFINAAYAFLYVSSFGGGLVVILPRYRIPACRVPDRVCEVRVIWQPLLQHNAGLPTITDFP